MRRRSLALAALGLVCASSAAGQPRDAQEAQISKWMKDGLIVKWYPDGSNSALVQVSEKWTSLPLDRQTEMAKAAGAAMLNAMLRRGAKIYALFAVYFTDDPARPIGDSLTHHGGDTAVYWDGWYRDQVKRDGGS